MKTLKLIALAAFALLFSQCKTTAPTAAPDPATSLLEVAQILDTTQSKFLQFADSTNGDPWKAIMLTTQWVNTQKTVQFAEALDSTYINITLKSGLQTTFYFDQVDSAGLSIFKGGGGRSSAAWSGSNDPPLTPSGILSTNTIRNRNVLIYSPGYSNFYAGPEQGDVTAGFLNGGGLTVTFLKNEQASLQALQNFKDYGLVIIDTHGEPDAFQTGAQIVSTESYNKIDISAIRFQLTLASQIGQDGIDKLALGLLRFYQHVSSDPTKPNWGTRVTLGHNMAIWVSSGYVVTVLPQMPSTVIFGNMCNSGWTNPLKNGHAGIATAFFSKNPISYYGYAYDGGISGPVHNLFAFQMMNTFSKNLAEDLDSTGRAYLTSGGQEYYDIQYPPQFLKLYCKHLGADNYSYSTCIDHFTDGRDGHIYKAVCIGNQTWMAENLDYDVPGSYDYNNDPANGKIYGKLYNFATLMQGAAPSTKVPSGVQGVCPPGWHVPSDSEFAALKAFVSAGNTSAGGPLKSTSSLWQTPNTGATNSTGFSALPGGIGTPPTFSLLGQNAFFNTSTATISPTYTAPTIYSLSAFGNGLSRDVVGDASRSCRCVKDP